MAIRFPENLLMDLYGVASSLQITSETGSMLERVIKTYLTQKDADALFEHYRDACSLIELTLRHHCTAAEVVLSRTAAMKNLEQYLYVTPDGVLGDNNAYPRPLLRVLFGKDVPELREDITAVMSQIMSSALTTEQMRVIRAHYAEGISLEKVAVSEHCTLSKVKFLEQAALQRLRAYLPYFEVGGPDLEGIYCP